MLEPVNRYAAPADPGAGVLRADQFQVSYATNDIERAVEVFRERYGIREFRALAGKLPAGGHIHVELAWVGSIMYELIQASGPGSDLFRHGVPEGEFVITHHHLGFLVYSEEEWDALKARIEQQGDRLLQENNTEGFLRHCFVDAPELGHYLEYIFPEPAGLAFFNDVPRN